MAKSNIHSSHADFQNLIRVLSEPLDDDPEALHAYLRAHGIDQDKLIRDSLQLIAELEDHISREPSRAAGRPAAGVAENVSTADEAVPGQLPRQKKRYRFAGLPGRLVSARQMMMRAAFLFHRKLVGRLRPLQVFISRTGRIYLNGTPGIVLLATVVILTTLPVYSMIVYSAGITIPVSITISLLIMTLIWATGGIVSYRLLKHAPPKKYAQILIDGYSPVKAIQFVSNEIRKLASEFIDSRHSRKLDLFFRRLEKLPEWEKLESELSEHQEELISNIQELKKICVRQSENVHRVLALKYAAARQTGLQERQICDYIFEFSPAIYHNRVLKYLSNCEELLEAYPCVRSYPELEERLRSLIRQNNRIMVKIRHRRDYQKQILRYTELIEPAHRFITNISISGAIREYARTIAQVSRETLALLPADSDRHKSAMAQVLRDYHSRLMFLYYKQRARGGFDLHYSLFRLCQTQCINNFDLNRLLIIQTQVLEKILQFPKYNLFLEDSDTARLQISALSRLSETVMLVMAQGRKGVLDKFGTYFAGWIKEDTDSHDIQPRLIITHSYSRTVREVMKQVIMKLGNEADTEINRATQSIFIYKPKSGDTFKERLMMYDLKDSDLRQNFRNSFAGIDKLMQPTKIMFLIGAECFDKNGWVFHPEGICDDLKMLKQMAKENEVDLKVVVVAESYKAYPRLVELPEYYQGRFDNISIYPPDLVDVIISDKEIIHITGSGRGESHKLMWDKIIQNVRTY